MQKYFLVVNLVRKVPIEQLVAQLKHGKIISKERVIRESMFSIYIPCDMG